MLADIVGTNGWRLARPLAAAAVVFLLAAGGIELTRYSDRIASVWLANGALLALLLRAPREEWSAMVAAAFTANIAANLACGDSPGPAVGLAACNSIETLLVARLLGRLPDPQLLLHPSGILRLSLAALFAALGAAAFAVVILLPESAAAAAGLFRQWIIADALGIVIVTPIGLVMTERWGRAPKWNDLIEPAAMLTLVAMVMTLIFVFSTPALFLLTPLLLLAGFRLHPVAAATVGLGSSVLAVLFTVNEFGPIAVAGVSDEFKTLLLQANIAVSLMLTIPVSVATQERRKLVQDLAVSEADHRLLAETSTDIIARIAVDGTLLYASSAASRILGYSPDSVAGVGASWKIHADDLPKVKAVFARACRGIDGQVARYRQERVDGSYIWLEAVYRLAERDGSREIVASIRDIDQRRQAELIAAEVAAKLRESNRLLTMAEDLADVGHWRVDIATGTFDCSRLARRVAGADSTGELSVQMALERIVPADRFAARRAIVAAMRRNGRGGCRLRLSADDGTVRHIRFDTRREMGDDDSVVGLFGVLRDIGEKVANEERLIAARDEARAAAEAKSAFLATMSHEIRTPMTGVLGMIELLGADPEPEARSQYLATLRQSANLLMAVLNDVLDYSKIDHGMLELKTCDFNLEALSQSTLDLFFNAASSKGLLIGLDIDAGPSPFVQGDPVRLQQVLSNLINNAIKFTDRGQIRVRVQSGERRAGQRTWRFEVRDTGIGIDDLALPALFQPFTQAESGDGRRFGGTGLGLAISRRLVEAMNGRIGVDSKPGSGSTFWFELPMADSRSKVEATQAAPGLRLGNRTARKLSVLVAEDNPVNQLLVEALLRRMGHQASCVANGREAVDLASREAFDCILMDMQMPELDGIGATGAIRSGGGPCADVPIIALTADASPERRRFYDQAGLSGFMTKPVDSAELEARLALIAARGDGPPPDTFDQAHLDRLRAALGPSRLKGLLDLFGTELARKPREIADHIAGGNFTAAACEAHSLKGAALSVGAGVLAEAAAAMEQAAASGLEATARLSLERLSAAVSQARAALPPETIRQRRTGA